MGTENAAEAPGAGAAGGLGFAFRTALGAELVSGTDLVLQTIGASKNLTDADLFITGEGRLDSQTARGKDNCGRRPVPGRLNPKCVAVELCGSIGERPETIHALGLTRSSRLSGSLRPKLPRWTPKPRKITSAVPRRKRCGSSPRRGAPRPERLNAGSSGRLSLARGRRFVLPRFKNGLRVRIQNGRNPSLAVIYLVMPLLARP